jgi:hypothetical protein
MAILLPLGSLQIARAALFSIFAFLPPGYLFLRLDRKYGTLRRAFGREEHEPLFEGILEKAAASAVISVIICSLVFTALTFSVGLDFWTALVGVSAVILLEGYLVWKEKL